MNAQCVSSVACIRILGHVEFGHGIVSTFLKQAVQTGDRHDTALVFVGHGFLDVAVGCPTV